jgi:hypothetical protein
MKRVCGTSKGYLITHFPILSRAWMCVGLLDVCLSVHMLEFSSLDLCFCYLIKKIKQHLPCLLLLKELISFTGPRQWNKSINPVSLSVIMSLGTELHLYLTLEWNMAEILLHKTMHNLPRSIVLSCNTKPSCRPVLRKCSVMCSNIREVVNHIYCYRLSRSWGWPIVRLGHHFPAYIGFRIAAIGSWVFNLQQSYCVRCDKVLVNCINIQNIFEI